MAIIYRMCATYQKRYTIHIVTIYKDNLKKLKTKSVPIVLNSGLYNVLFLIQNIKKIFVSISINYKLTQYSLKPLVFNCLQP